jgi:hypothetical protein
MSLVIRAAQWFYRWKGGAVYWLVPQWQPVPVEAHRSPELVRK